MFFPGVSEFLGGDGGDGGDALLVLGMADGVGRLGVWSVGVGVGQIVSVVLFRHEKAFPRPRVEVITLDTYHT